MKSPSGWNNCKLHQYYYLLYNHQWNTRWAFVQTHDNFKCENNKLSSHVKGYYCHGYIITCNKAEKYTYYIIILFFEYLNSPRFAPHGIHLSSSLILLLFHCLRWTQLSSKKVMRLFTDTVVFLKLTIYCFIS